MIADKKAHIMVVDDIPENLQIIANMLNLEGYETSFALNGKQAIDKTSFFIPDLILLDISMPVMDGFEACRILKREEKTRDIPIIFLTAKTEIDSIIKGFELGAADYVSKPFNVYELLARVKSQIEIKKNRDLILHKNLELSNLVEQLSEKNQQLYDLNATKDKFFSIISHDLRNPFSILLMCSELLLEHLSEYDSFKIEEKVKSIYRASKLLNSLMDNLFEWARSQTGQLQLNFINLNLKEVILESIVIMENYASSKNIQIINKVTDDYFIFSDKNILQTILRNLFANAIKFTPSDGSIIISLKQMDGCCEISISDTGRGIANEFLDKLFRIDTKYSTEGTAQEKGSGLGLILCKEFIEKLGGTIRVESELGKGSTFYIRVKSN